MKPTIRKGHFTRPDIVNNKLYVITPVFNPKRYRSRWKLYKEFESYVLNDHQAHLVTIECSFGKREQVITKQPSPLHTVIHVYTSHELWVKENLINIAISRLPLNWKYVAWVDADIRFARPDWVGETIQQLQHYDFLQMFSQAVDLSPTYEIIRTHKGFVYCHHNDIPNLKISNLDSYYPDTPQGAYWHPGFAWAAKKHAINHVGGLIDWAILGGGDMFMAYALVGKLEGKTMPTSLGKAGVSWLKQWQWRCNEHIKQNIGYMEGAILHYWHGKKADRKYQDRGQILIDSKFDPNIHIKKDFQGLYQLENNNPALKEGIRKYLSKRNEDSIDLT